ncbi:MAG TPA: MaoC/PaaZ C-terminal domain-containing protein [Acidimicrobiales bacterium]|nr:MaoC/PaaZ C-terminal domain-containing protein [Acidimicrobiales bacterium]
MKFEDFKEGQEFVSGTRTVSQDEMIEFARRYDNQPMHTDPAAAAASPFGGLIASGFMTLAVAWQLWLDMGLQGEDGRGGIAMERVRWYKPLRPGDTVRATVTIGEHRVSSKGHGIVNWAFMLRDEAGEPMLSFDTTGILARR